MQQTPEYFRKKILIFGRNRFSEIQNQNIKTKIFILIENSEGCSICSDMYLHIALHVAVTNFLVIALGMDRWFLQQKYRKIIWIQV